ncbi:MAG: DUF2256 and DUF3253 domain-containing protein [Actinobacteria bacterium]|nr:DUF2256 and DUF3253 domain-containing protein [Actinomycetota bacterium]
MTTPPEKDCVVCGRTITWRKKWSRSWDEVRHCSDACRKRGIQPVDQDLETAIMELLASRPRNATICPNDAAKLVVGEEWDRFVEPARAAARRLSVEGRVVITQGGHRVDPSTAKGPIRIGLT